LTERPVGHSQTALEFLRLKRQALKDLLEYFRHAGVYGQPELPATNLAVNNMTVVPLELLTDEELEFDRVLAEKGRAIPIDAPKEPPAKATGSNENDLFNELGPTGRSGAKVGASQREH